MSEKLLCRTRAASLLGVSASTLKRYKIPYTQYSRFGYALYKKSDLDAFKKKSERNGGIHEIAT